MPLSAPADFVVCLAMFRADYEEAEIWAIMTDPSNGISEMTLEKGLTPRATWRAPSARPA